MCNDKNKRPLENDAADGLRLMKAFLKISDPVKRRDIIEWVEKAASKPEDDRSA